MSFHNADPALSSSPFAAHGGYAGSGSRPTRLLPDQIEESLRATGIRLAGAVLVVLALAVWASLLTWSIDDPTSPRAAAGPAANLLGMPGAVVSDLLLQGFGLASAFAALPLVFWGAAMALRQRVVHWRLKLVLWMVGVYGLAGAFAAMPVVQAWRIPHGFGGFMGDFVLAMAGSVMAHVSAAHTSGLSGLALLLIGTVSLFAALGAGRQELAMIWHGENWRRIERDASAQRPTQPSAWRGSSLTARGGAGPGRTTGQAGPAPAPGASLFELAAELWRHRPGRADRTPLRRMLDRASARQPSTTASGQFPLQAYPSSHVHGPSATIGPQGYQQQGYQQQGHQLDAQHEGPIGSAIDPDSHAIAVRFAPRGAVAMRPAGAVPPVAVAAQPGYAPEPGPEFGHGVVAMPTPAPAAPPAPALPAAAGPQPAAKVFMRGWKGRPSPRHAPQGYRPPAVTLLKRATATKPGPEYSHNVQRGVAKLLEDVLVDFGIKGQIQAVKPGPVVTLYELEPARGVKSSRIVGLSDDIARSMSATSARVAGIPGRNVIGIELPNMRRETVYLRELLETETYQSGQCTLPVILGKGIGGEPIIADLARMPHVLVAGTTGSGKSVGINAMILSLLYRLGPEQCRFLMIDPKMLELSVYNGIPHLLAPVITEPHKAVAALNWVVREMEERYKRMSQLAVRNIEVFNGRIRQAAERGEELARTVQTGFDPVSGEPVFETERMQLEAMPYIVVVVDEMADLMLTAGKEIEGAVQRLAQMARAAGIHLIMATQRPSVDVITGTIKANFPTRISFKVTSRIDSRTILGEQGAEQLLGAGDMLFSTGTGQIVRVHGPFVADEEVEQIAAYLRTLGEPAYVAGIGEDTNGPDEIDDEAPRDESEDIYDKAVAVVLRDRKASTSYIQRRLSIGYNRAADIMERMEAEGLVSPANSVGKRNILVGEAKAG